MAKITGFYGYFSLCEVKYSTYLKPKLRSFRCFDGVYYQMLVSLPQILPTCGYSYPNRANRLIRRAAIRAGNPGNRKGII